MIAARSVTTNNGTRKIKSTRIIKPSKFMRSYPQGRSWAKPKREILLADTITPIIPSNDIKRVAVKC